MEATALMLPSVRWLEEKVASDSDSDSDSDSSAEFDEDNKVASAEVDEEEMHFKSRCEKCKTAQQSSEYLKITPSKISKWSFQVQLKGKGTYECSATGLVFEVSEQALVRYSVLSWFQFSEFLQDSWRPAGSIWNVDVVNKDPSVLKFIHFPHSLCLAEPEHELSFSVLHVKDRHANIETTVDFTSSHVKWRVSSLSPVGLIIPSSLQVKHHALVLIYKERIKSKKKISIFHVFLASNDGSEIQAIEEQVLSSHKILIKMYKSAACRLGEKFHCLTSKPKGQIEPPDWKFKKKPSVKPRRRLLPFKKTQVANIRPGGELQRIRSECVQRVSISVIKGLLDDLWQQKVFSTEDKDTVMENHKIRADQARCLIDMVMGKGERASQIMIDSMKERDPELCITLGLISSPSLK
ncbi:NACHT, LRR and PYD domains-containing protein 1 homolog isoform X4 [Gadus macrocephalus]|uniref:NACHT, LRR and PYD domains-containing protein 1 homolog isoform X4 n=1 Tax=Gadus macrocephalus TaxID=80720 RepID=UPI0028CBBD16|nr:NACHT, LRR and PYD domains-containing protein 1 homolog isoform X4 [Gadus macrocephalus]